MPYRRGAPSLPVRERDVQVFNARCRPLADPSLAPVSDEPAELVRAGMAPLLSGQTIPMIGERVAPDADDCVRYAL